MPFITVKWQRWGLQRGLPSSSMRPAARAYKGCNREALQPSKTRGALQSLENEPSELTLWSLCERVPGPSLPRDGPPEPRPALDGCTGPLLCEAAAACREGSRKPLKASTEASPALSYRTVNHCMAAVFMHRLWPSLACDRRCQ